MKSFFQKYNIEIFVFFVASVARFLALAYGVLHYGDGILSLSDSKAFLDLAHAVASGQGYSRDGGLTAFVLRPPGYSFYLAGFFWLFHRFWPAIIGQVALSSFVPVLLARLGKNLMMNSRAVFWAAMISALEPHLVIYSIVYMSEALYGFLFLASIVYFIRFLRDDTLRFLLVSSVLLGISAYVRPVSNYLFFLYPVAILYRWRGAKDVFRDLLPKAFFAVAVFFAIIFPWMFRNYEHFGVFSMGSHGPYNLYVYDGASIVALEKGVSYDEGARERIAAWEKETGVPVTVLHNDLRYDNLMQQKAVAFVKEHFFTAAKLGVITDIGFWTAHNYAYFITYFYRWIPQPTYHIPPTQLLFEGKIKEAFLRVAPFLFSPYYVISFAGRMLWFLVALAMICGMRVLWRDGDRVCRSFTILCIIIFVYFSLIVFAVGLGIDGRQRYPIEPLVILFAVLGWRSLRDLIKRGMFLSP